MTSRVIVDPNVYEEGLERRTLDLRPEGVACIPLLGLANFQSVHTGPDEHIHPNCIEISLCLRGRLFFYSQGVEYPFFPGTIFVSQPTEPHRMCNNPKGLRLMRILFAIPKGNKPVLGLSIRESQWIVHELKTIPFRLFPATARVRDAFERLFAAYDAETSPSIARQLKLKASVLDLLLAIIEAPHAPPSPKGKPIPRVSAIVRRIHDHPEAVYDLAAMASEAALSSVAFIDAFKRMTGLPPHAYLLDQRVRAADGDLAHGTQTVAEIAKHYHFSSPQHLAAAFRRILGHSPRRNGYKNL